MFNGTVGYIVRRMVAKEEGRLEPLTYHWLHWSANSNQREAFYTNHAKLKWEDALDI
jgi:hypothetical protein